MRVDLPPLALFLWLSAVSGAQAQSLPTRPTPARIHADLGRILSGTEFQPPGTGKNPLENLLKWLGDKWNAFWEFIGKLFAGHAGAGGSVLQWVFIALFIALGAWLLARLITQILRYQRPSSRAPQTAYTEADFESETVTEPDVWLQQGQRYAAEGDFRRAFRAVFLAILLQMDRAGAIQYDRSRTNGDYLRMLRGPGLRALYEAMRPLSSDFDLRWYGNHPTTQMDYRRCLDEYDRIRGLLAATASPAAGSGGRPAFAAGRG